MTEIIELILGLTLILALTILSGIICSQIAKRKGYSSSWYFWLGMFFSTMTFIFVLILPLTKDEKIRRLLSHGYYQLCPKCSSVILKKARKCRHCGSVVEKKEQLSNVQDLTMEIEGAESKENREQLNRALA